MSLPRTTRCSCTATVTGSTRPGARARPDRPGHAAHAAALPRAVRPRRLELLVDADREAYKVAGAKIATRRELLGPQSVTAGIERSRQRADGPPGPDRWATPPSWADVLVVARTATSPGRTWPTTPSDNPANDEVLAAARRAADQVDAAATALTSYTHAAGWSSQVARRAHNPKVAGSNPAPATHERPANRGPFVVKGPARKGAVVPIGFHFPAPGRPFVVLIRPLRCECLWPR